METNSVAFLEGAPILRTDIPLRLAATAILDSPAGGIAPSAKNSPLQPGHCARPATSICAYLGFVAWARLPQLAQCGHITSCNCLYGLQTDSSYLRWVRPLVPRVCAC